MIAIPTEQKDREDREAESGGTQAGGSAGAGTEETEQSAAGEDAAASSDGSYEQRQERRLEEVLRLVEGVGDVEVMITLEAGSEHPLAEAIMEYTEVKGIKPSPAGEFEALFGRGVRGRVGERNCFAGNLALMEENQIPVSDEVQSRLNDFADQGKTPLIFASEGKVIGIIAVADVEKESSREAIAAFEKMNIDVVMLTGDNKRTAEALRKRLRIPKVIAEVLPSDKEKHIAALQAEGHKVAMIGDGINDAPALARADVGIAIGAGTDVAIESADIVLMKSDLLDVSTAIQLSKAVIRNIKQNLFWAFIYNIIGIPVAAGVFYLPFALKLNPMIGAFAMSFSSVFVVSNALRLRWFKAKHQANTELDSDPMYEQTTVKEERKGAIHMEKVLNIEGMVCGMCVKHVDKALRESL
mgnify:CR=1 FL=1